jgi:hypothetical protein
MGQLPKIVKRPPPLDLDAGINAANAAVKAGQSTRDATSPLRALLDEAYSKSAKGTPVSNDPPAYIADRDIIMPGSSGPQTLSAATIAKQRVHEFFQGLVGDKDGKQIIDNIVARNPNKGPLATRQGPFDIRRGFPTMEEQLHRPVTVIQSPLNEYNTQLGGRLGYYHPGSDHLFFANGSDYTKIHERAHAALTPTHAPLHQSQWPADHAKQTSSLRLYDALTEATNHAKKTGGMDKFQDPTTGFKDVSPSREALNTFHHIDRYGDSTTEFLPDLAIFKYLSPYVLGIKKPKTIGDEVDLFHRMMKRPPSYRAANPVLKGDVPMSGQELDFWNDLHRSIYHIYNNTDSKTQKQILNKDSGLWINLGDARKQRDTSHA